ncbi:MAG: hypothetical protein KQI35_14020 [Bacteroidetes bacterium]|nr:hypothetical protein [Bacteroidota bacterium]
MSHFQKILLVITAFLSIQIYATEPDSLVIKSDLSFHSNLEKVAFESLDSDNGPNYIYLFIAIDDSCGADELNDIKRRISNQISSYENNSKFINAKEKKKVKTIYSDIHEDYLKKYEEGQYFPDLFNEGLYNCVTASAYYGLIFQNLNIPYTIKESYDHVYILTYPETFSIRVETTDPRKGYLVYDDRFKSQFVDFLKESKLISETEYKQKTSDELFNEYFYKEEDINLLELAGLQYYNKAVDCLANQKYEEAFAMVEKSAYLHPSERAGYMLLICVANVLNGCKYEDIHYADYIFKAARYDKYGIKNDNIIDQFIDVTQKLLIAQYNTKLYDAYFNRIIDNLEDSVLINEISFIYYYERARILLNDNKFDLSLVFAEKAYNLKPKHVDARNLFVTDVLETFSQINDFQESLDQLNRYITTYPDIMNNNQFNTLRGTLTLGMSVDFFMSGNTREAFGKLGAFEEIAENSTLDFGNYILNEVLVEAYSRAASYHFRKGNSKASREYLERGLKYAPNSYELSSKLRSLNY